MCWQRLVQALGVRSAAGTESWGILLTPALGFGFASCHEAPTDAQPESVLCAVSTLGAASNQLWRGYCGLRSSLPLSTPSSSPGPSLVVGQDGGSEEGPQYGSGGKSRDLGLHW